MWTGPQRGVILLFLVIVIAASGYRYYTDRVTVPDPQPADGARAADLADHFDPNTATAAELAAIPNVGDKLAAAIVDYRNTIRPLRNGSPVFERPTDLMRVRGIGPAKMEAMTPYLRFPATRPATTRASR